MEASVCLIVPGTLPMTSSKEYARFALECGKRAEQTKDERLRKLLTQEARLWMEVALEVERSWALMDDDDPAKCGTRADSGRFYA